MGLLAPLFWGFCLSCCVGSLALHKPRMSPLLRRPQSVRSDLLDSCTLRWRTATLDHFSWGVTDLNLTTFQQRYFVCDKHWKPTESGEPGPIFFYLGNEADVTLYLNNSGLMWESAPEFGALLVFAEHRYYGKSIPYGDKVRKHMGYLTAEQAMADYAELIWELKNDLDAQAAPVIGFGGSYGGMLASWFRMKYPHLMAGAIAASAPIWSFMGESPAFDSGSFAKGVSYDASVKAGAAPHCNENVKQGWQLISTLGQTQEGRAQLRRDLSLCDDVVLDSSDDVLAVRDWLAAAWDFMAMGNYPYPSGYILNGAGELPAWPVRQACSHLGGRDLTDQQIITGLAAASGVFYNVSGDLACYDLGGVNPDTEQDGDFWDWQYCTEMFMPFSKDGVSDMFWWDPWQPAASVAACEATWGVQPRQLWATLEWGGRAIASASNIVFSNGLMDPWHGGGVLRDVSDTVVAVIIPEGAHHLDLMFSHDDDPQSVKEARHLEKQAINDWIQQARGQQPSQTATTPKQQGKLHPSSSSSSSSSLPASHLSLKLRGSQQHLVDDGDEANANPEASGSRHEAI